MTEQKIPLPPATIKEKHNQICGYCKKVSVEPLKSMKINAIESKFCPECYLWVCQHLVNKGGVKSKTS